MAKRYYCPKHRVELKEVEDYPGALVCPLGAEVCPDIFTVIDGHLCVVDGAVWRDTKTGGVRKPSPTS